MIIDGANGHSFLSTPGEKSAKPDLGPVGSAGLDATKVPLDPSDAAMLVAEANRALEGLRSLDFSVNEDLGRTVVRVVDAETDTLVRQIPSEAMVALAVRMRALKGLLFDDRA